MTAKKLATKAESKSGAKDADTTKSKSEPKPKSSASAARSAGKASSTTKASAKAKTSTKVKTSAKDKAAAKAKPRSRAGSAAGRSLPTFGARMGFAPPEALVAPLPPGVRYLGVVAGTVDGQDSPTACFNAGATDLCEVVPSGEVAVAGDTWRGPHALGLWEEWSPSLALHVSSLAGKVQFDGKLGWRGKLYQEGWRDLYANGVWGPDTGVPVNGCSQLPAGTVRVKGHDYLMVTRTKDLVPQDSRLVVIDPDKEGWPTVAGSTRPASFENGSQTQISGCEGVDGWVYIVADDFHRRKPLVLYRCLPEDFTDRGSWQGWGMDNGNPNLPWRWGHPGQPPTPLSADLFGELSLRVIEGKYVLSAFNVSPADGGRLGIEVHVADPTHDPNIITQIVRRNGEHGPYALPCKKVVGFDNLSYLYGGYIVPGSTLKRTRILVSQWAQRPDPNDPTKLIPLEFPYNVREYEVDLT